MHIGILPLQIYPHLREGLIQIRLDPVKNLVWLNLTNTSGFFSGGQQDGGQVCRGLVGGTHHGGQGNWDSIKPVDYQTQQTVRDIYFNDHTLYTPFQRAIINYWSNFSRSTASDYVNSKAFVLRSVFDKLTSAFFVLEALKKGYEGINQHVAFPMQHKSLTKHELVAALITLPLLGTMPAQLEDFVPVLPNPYYDAITYPFEGNLVANKDTRTIPVINSARAASHTGNFAYATELQGLGPSFPRVVTYGFRGDTRAPHEVFQYKGFTPNATRPSHIAQGPLPMQVQGAPWQPLDLSRFLFQQHLGEFISTSKSVAIARYFATSTWPGGKMVPASTDGWVYACYVEGAIMVPKSGTPGGVNVPFDEQELTMPGLFDWADVVACRKVLQSGRFTGPVYVKPELENVDRTAAIEIYDLLSGKSQGPSPGELI